MTTQPTSLRVTNAPGAGAEPPTPTRRCAKCGTAEPGPGGILCPPCRTRIEAAGLLASEGTP